MSDEYIPGPEDEFVLSPEGEQYLHDLDERLLRLAQDSEFVDTRRRTVGVCPTGYWQGYKFCLHTIPKLRKLAEAVGDAIVIKMIQGSFSTSTSASSGTHAGGGAGDNALGAYSLTQDYLVMNVARDTCLLVYWPRPYIQGLWSNHGHFIDPHCPSLSAAAAAQVVDFKNGLNGLANDRPDFGSRRSVARIWDAYLNRASTTVAKIEALMFPPPPPPPDEETELMAITVKHPTTGEQWTLSNALWSMWTYVLENRNNLTVLNKAVVALAESEALDDAEREAALAAVAEQLRQLQVDMDAVEAMLREQPPDPPEPDPAFTFGFDMSGHQTVEQVQAQLDNPDMSFAIIKATEGYAFVNSRFTAQAAAVNASDIAMRGWYHFGWQSHDGVQEAQHFWRTIEPVVRSGDCWFGDIENWDQVHNYADMAGITWEQRFDFYMAFRAEMQRLSGSLGSIYPLWTVIKAFRELCGMKNEDGTIKSTPTPEWLEFTEAGLWLPQYMIGTGAARHAVQPGECDFVSGGWDLFIHQYTSSPFDQNWMPGGKQLWTSHAIP